MEKAFSTGKAKMKTIRQWFRNARAGALPQSMMPAMTAVLMAREKEHFSFFLGALGVMGVAFAHLGFNLLDDYFDYISHQTGYRHVLDRAGFRAYTAKCPYLQDRSATLRNLACAIACFGAVAAVCGMVIFIRRGMIILQVGTLAGIFGYFYSGRPFRLSYHGFGEAVVGIMFGPLNMMGVYASACGQIDPAVMIMGIVMGILVTVILFTHSILDYAADQSVGKKTLAALFPREPVRLAVFYGMNVLPYLLITGAAVCGILSWWYLLVWLVFPFSLELCCSMRTYMEHPQKEVRWKAWYGPVTNWDRRQELGVDWFLVRWLLARNIVTYFSVVSMIAVWLSGGAG